MTLQKEGKVLWQERAIWPDVSPGMVTIGRNFSAERERYAQRGCQWADSGR